MGLVLGQLVSRYLGSRCYLVGSLIGKSLGCLAGVFLLSLFVGLMLISGEFIVLLCNKFDDRSVDGGCINGYVLLDCLMVWSIHELLGVCGTR